MGNAPSIAPIRGLNRTVSAADPDPVVHDHRIEYPLLPEAFIPFSGMTLVPAYDRRWVES
ncbi:hypothetical protein GCM10009076_17040 [Erythrobacter ramosus]